MLVLIPILAVAVSLLDFISYQQCFVVVVVSPSAFLSFFHIHVFSGIFISFAFPFIFPLSLVLSFACLHSIPRNHQWMKIRQRKIMKHKHRTKSFSSIHIDAHKHKCPEIIAIPSNSFHFISSNFLFRVG